MCGLCGFSGEIVNREQILHQMAQVITHRGPDADGYYLDQGLAMAFRRLSIIDLETGNQPLFNEDGSLVLMFNGEIYNYRQLREQLQQAGHQFSTESDSEVLLHGFEEWKEDLLPRLRGMFAFAIWNKQTNTLFLARDPFGIKPMHYCLLPDGRLVYGSEIKSLLQHPDVPHRFNKSALNHYLSFQYSMPRETFFEEIYCLRPAHYLTYQNGTVQEHRYWEAVFAPDRDMSLQQAVDEIDRAFENSVEAHRIADVEVGCFLSGGVDSSYVASYFEGQQAFSVGFDHGQHYDETAFAAELAQHLNIRHHKHIIDKEEYWQAIAPVQYALDQPLADPACIALYFVSRLASEHVKVVLSGEGADELFGGYRIYNEPFSLAGYQKLPRWLRCAAARIAQAIPFEFKGKSFAIRGSKTLEQRFIGNAYMFNKKEKQRLLKDIVATDPAEQTRQWFDRCAEHDEVTRMQYVDINTWMVGDILLKADRMSMIHSLELRVPFLDKEVFNVARRIPTKHRIAEGTTKYALRLAAQRHMPKSSTVRPKLGFPVPIRIWLRQDDCYQTVRTAFTSNAAAAFFHTEELLRLLDQHRAGKKDNSRKIWTVYAFLVWYQQYFPEK